MAVRKHLNQTQKTRDKIKASQLINRLVKHVDGEVELSATQVNAARILLNKVIPDLKAVEHSGIDGEPIAHSHNHTLEFVNGSPTATK